MTPFAMLYTVAVGVPIAWAALALSAVLRRYGRPERGVWASALVLSLAVPALALLAPATSATVDAASAADSQVGAIGLPEFVVVPVPVSSLDWGRLALFVWLSVSTVLAIRWAVAAYRLSRASRSWTSGTIDGVSVWMTDDVGPAVSGTIHPRVLAPSWLHTLPTRQRALILMHEEEHIRARDPLLIAFTRAARILAPWNPVVWIVASRLVRAVELDCDRRVLRRTSDVAAYGHTLLTVSKRRPGRLVAVAAFAESEAPLRTRILSMTTPPRTVSIVAIAASTILGVVLLVGALQVPVPTISLDIAVTPQPDETPTVTAFDAPPTPPAPPTADIEVPTVILSTIPLAPPSVARELARLQAEERRLAPTRVPDAEVLPPVVPQADLGVIAPPPTSQQVPEPAMTPMTVRPMLTNVPDVQQALMREYPTVLRDAGIGGAPVLWIHIAADGTVDATRIFQGSGYAALDEAAQRVAAAMRFSPARNREEIVAVWVQIPIRFAVVN